MDNTRADGILSNNIKGEMEDEFNNCIENKVYIYETIIGGELIYQEPCDTDNKQGSTHNYVSIKDENIDDLTEEAQETELMSDYTNNKVCVDKTALSRRYTKQEPCSMNDKQGNIDNYINIENEIVDDLTVVAQQSKFVTDSADDKVCVYETIINGGYIKDEPCKSGNIHSNVNINDENTVDFMFIIVQETELLANPKVNYFICCEECGEEYDLYCLKCPMLFRIFDSNNPNGNDNTVRWTLPNNFLDICETPSGTGIVALRTIPQGVVFGPFKGLDSTKDDAVSKWKLKNQELVCTKDPRWLNWMQYIRIADQGFRQNLIPFQYEGGLYYRSECHINVGDELLVRWDSDSDESEIQDMEQGYWEPPVYECLDDSYACTLCCVGYKSINQLIAHNCVCCEKRNKNDFCKEIVQCNICRIYLDKKEYADYHMGLCYNSNERCGFKMCYRNRLRPLSCNVDTKQINCESGDVGFWNTRLFLRHKKEVHAHGDETRSFSKCKYRTRFQYAFSKHLVRPHNGPKLKRFACTLCPYKTTTKGNLKLHIAIHNDDRPFVCTHCTYRATTNSKLKQHIAVHNGDKPFACTLCPYKAATNCKLKQHIASHNSDKPFACSLCPYKATTNWKLKQHTTVHNDDKRFECSLCPYKTPKKGNLKLHIAVHNDDRPFVCTLCRYKTTTNSKLKLHIAVHNDDRSFPCTLCPYKATTGSNLKIHNAIHNGERPFACTLCPYKAKKKPHLKEHMAIHNGDKPFACTLCPYKTTTKSNLKQHIASHNGDKPFGCTLCSYKATKKGNLKQHIATHNGDKPFACTLCPYTTKRKSCLKQHVAVHNDDRPFACNLCPYKATTNWKVKQHLLVHNDERHFVCTLCPYKATTERNLKQHIAIHNDVRTIYPSEANKVS